MPEALAELLTTWLTYLRAERRSSPHTIEAYERDVGRFLEFMSEKLDVSDLRGLLALRAKDIRPYLAAQANKARTSVARGFHAVRSNDQIILEPKEHIEGRLGFSPDAADAAALTFAFPVGNFDEAHWGDTYDDWSGHERNAISGY